jgi:hypothetical protein
MISLGESSKGCWKKSLFCGPSGEYCVDVYSSILSIVHLILEFICCLLLNFLSDLSFGEGMLLNYYHCIRVYL